MALVTDYDAGVDGHEPVTMEAVMAVMRANVSHVQALISDAIAAGAGFSDREVLAEEGRGLRPRGLRRGRVPEHVASWLSNAWPAGSTLSANPGAAGDRRVDGLDLLVRDVGVGVAEVEQRRAGHVVELVQHRRRCPSRSS